MSIPRRAPGGFPVVGIIGGGQLARMCVGPAAELGIGLSVLVESPEASAGLVAASAPVGDAADLGAVLEFASHCDVVTFDHELIPSDTLAALVDAGVRLQPSPEALRYAQDKLAMRRRLTELGLACPRWTEAAEIGDVERFAAEVGWPVVAKTPRGGYDGRGVVVAHDPHDLDPWLAQARTRGEALLLEERVSFTREIAVILARRANREVAVWPVSETVQVDGICTDVIAPAPGVSSAVAAAAVATAVTIAEELDVTGVMAVEMFLREDGTAIVNELAMRPHNSGHWTMDGAITGQFEQHLRAVLDLPLGSPHPRAPWSVMANVLGGADDLYPAYREILAADPGLKVHLYGKGIRPGRKLGHVTASGEDLSDLRRRTRRAADHLQGAQR